MSFQEYSRAIGRPWGQLVGCSVFASSNNSHSIRFGSRGVLILMAEWQAMEAAMRVRRAVRSSFNEGSLGLRDCSMTWASMRSRAAPSQADRSGLDCKCLRAKGFYLKAISLQFVGNLSKNHHLPRLQLDQQGHQQALALDLLYLAIAQNLFKKHSFVCHMLVDDPEAILSGGQDEGLAKLSQRPQGAELVEVGGSLFGFDLGCSVCAGAVLVVEGVESGEQLSCAGSAGRIHQSCSGLRARFAARAARRFRVHRRGACRALA